MPMHPHPTSFGVFKPVGHVLMAFATAAQADAAAAALGTAGFGASSIWRYTPGEMLAQADADIANADALASLGQELNLVKAHRAWALQGQSFIVVKVEDDEAAQRVATLAAQTHATRAQHYGRLTIEELVSPGQSERQTAESPDRGLDPQSSPSGTRNEVLSRDADA